jgi:DNA invertase Pin-like site-specific DNA recombinase
VQKLPTGLYARVSTIDQDCAIQLDNMRDLAKRHPWKTIEYVDKLSGKEGNKRPELERLLEDVRMKRIGLVVVWKLDRFGRSTLDTLTNIRTLEQYGVRFWCPSMNIDTDDRSPVGKFTLTILAAVAELERGFILERTQAGYEAYRSDYDAGKVGKSRHSKSKKDLPVGRPRAIFDRERARKMRDEGLSFAAISKILGVGHSTVHRELAA